MPIHATYAVYALRPVMIIRAESDSLFFLPDEASRYLRSVKHFIRVVEMDVSTQGSVQQAWQHPLRMESERLLFTAVKRVRNVTQAVRVTPPVIGLFTRNTLPPRAGEIRRTIRTSARRCC